VNKLILEYPSLVIEGTLNLILNSVEKMIPNVRKDPLKDFFMDMLEQVEMVYIDKVTLVAT